jgi:hypothetical protein
MCGQNGDQEGAVAATNVHKRPDAGEVVGIDDGARPWQRLFGHKSIETGASGGVLP